MKKVSLTIEFITKEGEVGYAILFTGVMTRRHIYAKRISITGSDDYVEYIKVSKADTKDITESCISIWNVPTRSIEVDSEIGVNDSRISINPDIPDEIMEAITEAVAEEESVLEAKIS